MKKFLLSFVFFASITVAFGQIVQNPKFPCPVDIQSNQGGGNCGPCLNPQNPNFDPTLQPTAKITLRFETVPACAPRLVAVVDNQGEYRRVLCGEPIVVGQQGRFYEIEYCIYGTENNDNFFNKQDVTAVLRYYCNEAGTTTTFPGGDFTEIACKSTGEQVPVPPPSGAPLPVNFKSFNAKRIAKDKVTLNWETAMESNNRGFQVQRNTGRGWNTVTLVASKANGGNSNAALSYEFTDVNTESGLTQYRLMQVDFDGKMKVSEVRGVRGEAQANKVMIYPNPSNDGSMNVLFDEGRGNRDVMISDMSGRIIKQFRNVTATTLRIDNLNPGVYSVRVINQADGAQSIDKVVVNK